MSTPGAEHGLALSRTWRRRSSPSSNKRSCPHRHRVITQGKTEQQRIGRRDERGTMVEQRIRILQLSGC